ncbi:arabinose-5-phosphate isomerase [Granulicella rosea]|uniref:Arabinose-5-phosphate isomerase n=1 Tax=Granulicella rosea TaxID=474952 RepID=A0A239IHD6_9BACT|nr:KpsF/GutQ family sugar-phosphate isomerase [Granulicella rosea]SNS92971.1 arabinose-5-phosphate isomerase [Granulicella rosea]
MANESATPLPGKDNSAARFVRVEAAALLELAARLENDQRAALEAALQLLEGCASGGHRVVVTGIGKSGIVARKIAATLRSTGTPAHFLHPAEALHGDLGMVAPGDLVLALSYSGETAEVLHLLPAFARIGAKVISLTGCATGTLAAASAVSLDVGVSEEACSNNLAPTASTTAMLALGDALALELSRRRGFQPEDFADLHPGGNLGRRLARVRDLMHAGEALPGVRPQTPMPEVIYEMSRKHLGMTTVLDESGRLAGIISDGDLRRLLERDGAHAMEKTAGEIMNPHPKTISPETFAETALVLMEQKKITSLIVVNPLDGRVEGVVHLHDLIDPKAG